jgi:DNA-binding winged helix-turn-helix (wHTH) protein
MQLPLVMPKPQHQPMGRDGSPIVEHGAPPTATDTMLEFGRFRVLLRQRRLLAGGVPVELGTRAFDILMVLLKADGALVTHDELQSRVWPGIAVARENLKVQIFALRKALGEDRELIRTENGRGYRFTAALRATVAAPECFSTRDAAMPPNDIKAASPTDLSVIAARLTLLEVRLAEALHLLGTHPGNSRLRRRRYDVGHSSRRTRRRRHAPILPLPSTRGRERRGQSGTVSARSHLTWPAEQEALALRPAELSGGHAEHLPEMTRQVTLVGKACGQCDPR